MGTPATKAKHDVKPAEKKRSFYKLRTQLLEQGRTNTLLAKTDNMWAVLKVYASGGRLLLFRSDQQRAARAPARRLPRRRPGPERAAQHPRRADARRLEGE